MSKSISEGPPTAEQFGQLLIIAEAMLSAIIQLTSTVGELSDKLDVASRDANEILNNMSVSLADK